MATPPGLGVRGRKLWRDITTGQTFAPADLMLVHEACRIADRLEKLDLLLRGDVDVWIRLTHRTNTEDYEIVIDDALSEARQQASALRLILTGLGLVKASPATVAKDGIDDLATRRAKRRTAG